ncbi:hypothetical protein F9C07_7919 [Aspergillus flavus]|uniref:Uncharacterized protein n=5 Tax=Aspergillus subgen. Circumdati TaxID=2720871 RepID=A0A7U2R2X1_ASPFN|nr:unnamed protein product [Aspergillus oryzae RIB40]EIT80988.1 hypothetical protein Ao3042_02512 [Aspergillus oryzae 3.042]KDE83324.1 hypothetical protein AO1008_09892 [Aspergillus oryzae 100-8]QRD93462.1 hypothetical protein F9C07_7919 [Aspergillus flavus]BAE56643.1 unnamed protein product [Aspergillus oryzae RIB40]|eukprot:EIT80988.1 hypothetical protein Ao3042_02512 [Aspergillus oryzae 3.042]
MSGLLKEAFMLTPLNRNQHSMAHWTSTSQEYAPQGGKAQPTTPARLDPEAKTFTNPVFEAVSPGGYRRVFSLGYLILCTLVYLLCLFFVNILARKRLSLDPDVA